MCGILLDHQLHYHVNEIFIENFMSGLNVFFKALKLTITTTTRKYCLRNSIIKSAIFMTPKLREFYLFRVISVS